jgi:hypothetical protein
MLNLTNLIPFSMKKLFPFILILIISWTQISAQKTKDVLYLKNGSKIYGKLVEVNSTQYKIQTSDGSEIIYSTDEVDKFTRESPLFEGRKAGGFTFTIETGLLIGPQSARYTAPFSFNFLGGVTSRTRNITSIGSGVEFIGRPYTPIFLEYKYIIYDRKTSPFIFFRGGAVIALGGDETSSTYAYDYTPKNYKGGASFGFGSGVSWAKEDYEIFFSFGYRYAHTSYEQYEGTRGDVTYNNTLNRLELKIGLKF